VALWLLWTWTEKVIVGIWQTNIKAMGRNEERSPSNDRYNQDRRDRYNSRSRSRSNSRNRY
jgi:hypothetical protein